MIWKNQHTTKKKNMKNYPVGKELKCTPRSFSDHGFQNFQLYAMIHLHKWKFKYSYHLIDCWNGFNSPDQQLEVSI